MGADVKRLVMIGLGAVILAACNSGGDAAPSTLSSTTTTTAATTVPATTVPDTTTSTSTTSSTTTSTSLAPTTTSATSTEDLIKQAVQDYSAAYHQCGVDPATCDPATFTAAQGESRSTISELIRGMDEQGLHFGTDIRGSYIVSESISMTSPVLADVTACWYDAGIVLGPLGPDGNPTVVDDQVLSYRYAFSVYLEGGQWRVGTQMTVARLGEGNLCQNG